MIPEIIPKKLIEAHKQKTLFGTDVRIEDDPF